MEVLSYIALILLSFVGYCAGAVFKVENSLELRTRIIDLSLMVVIWAGAVYSRITLDLNKWIMLLAWIIISISIGILATWPRKVAGGKASIKREEDGTSINWLARLWHRWRYFAEKMSNFQSRIVLSFFYFILILPVALGVMRSDPLGLKPRVNESHWLPKSETKTDLEQFRRQS